MALFAGDSGADCAESKPSSAISDFSDWRAGGRFYGYVLRPVYRLDPFICPAGTSCCQGHLRGSRAGGYCGINCRSADPEVYNTILSDTSNSRFSLGLGSTLETPRLDTLNTLPVD